MNAQNSIAIIGYGNQAKTWAKNLRDSGREVTILLRTDSSSFIDVEQNGFETKDLSFGLLEKFKYFIMLTPDHTHYSILDKIKDLLPGDRTFIYAHGFSFTTTKIKKINKEWNHLLLAPKAIASKLREYYVSKLPLAAVYDCSESNDVEDSTLFIKKLAKDLGITSGPYQASFEEETKADLLSEQSILCALIPYGALECYNNLRNKGVSQEVAYFESWYEVKLIVDTMIEKGPLEFFSLISPNALIGSEKGRKILCGKQFKNNMKKLNKDIFDNTFYKEVANTDFKKISKDVKDFWKKEELEQIHQKMSKDLFTQHGDSK